jgi:hypothetical protein
MTYQFIDIEPLNYKVLVTTHTLLQNIFLENSSSL